MSRDKLQQDGGKSQLWLDNRAALVTYASGLVGSRAEAEDVVQDAYLRFIPPEAEGDGVLPRHPLGYLYRIVRNLALDWRRKRRAEGIEPGEDAPLEAMASPLPDPERQAAGREELRRVARAVATLPPQIHRAFTLYRIDGLTLQQVADRLGVSVATAHRLVRAALMAIAVAADPP